MSNPETTKQRKRGLLAWVPQAAEKLRKMGRRDEAAELEAQAKKVRVNAATGKAYRALIASFQRLHKLSPTGVWNAPSIRAIRRFLPGVAEYHISRPRWRWNGDLVRRIGPSPGIVLHHPAAVTATAEAIHAGHQGRGFLGIGYTFYVRKNGQIIAGRPEWAMAAHTEGHNDMIGVSSEGNYDVEHEMPAAQLAATKWLVDHLRDKYRCPVYLHRDLNATGCPGKHYPVKAIRG